MDRLRTTLFKAAVIVLSGAFIGVVVIGFQYFSDDPTLTRFVREYDAASPDHQEQIAQRYMEAVPVQDLLQAVEKKYSASVCHTEAHPIGRALYRKESNFTEAIRKCGGSCSYGCFHGVLMEMFSTDSDTLGGVIDEETPEAYLSRVQAEAKDLCTKPEVESVVRSRYCYHGLGHVFASLSGADLKGAVDACSIFADHYVAAACRTGAFMEYVLSPLNRQEYLRTDEAPCDAFPAFKSSCYRYKAYGWIDGWGSVDKAFEGCAAFGTDELLCIRSVAQAASTRSLVQTKAEFQALCHAFADERRVACIQGSLLRTIELNNGDDSDHACDSLEEPYRGYCVEYLHGYLEVAF